MPNRAAREYCPICSRRMTRPPTCRICGYDLRDNTAEPAERQRPQRPAEPPPPVVTYVPPSLFDLLSDDDRP